MLQRTVLITGSSKGLGRELALVFSQKGDRIILHGRNKEEIKGIESEILEKNMKCESVIGDLRDQNTINSLYNIAKKRRLDILINNAGVYQKGSFIDMPLEKIREIIETNLLSPIFLTQRIYKIFEKRGSGLIVNINSLAGVTPNDKESAYCASKYGLRGFSNSFRHEAVKKGILVTDFYIGAMKTNMTNGRADQGKLIDPKEVAEKIYDTIAEKSSLTCNEVFLGRKKY